MKKTLAILVFGGLVFNSAFAAVHSVGGIAQKGEGDFLLASEINSILKTISGLLFDDASEILEVAGTVKATDFVKSDGSPVGGGSSFANIFEVEDKVGIGTDEPDTTLEVNGETLLGGDVSIMGTNESREWMTISMGERHACGLTKAGKAYCWGSNYWGQLGNGTNNNTYIPAAVNSNSNFKQIKAGGEHTCAINKSGKAYCWGRGDLGQLGNGNLSKQSSPVAVSSSLTFKEIGVGQYYTCGLTEAGKAYCWGYEGFGRLGNGGNRAAGEVTTPTAVSGNHIFTDIGVGDLHTCALNEAGKAYCWGYGNYGQLGNGDSNYYLVPKAVIGGLSFNQIEANNDHTCALTQSGKAYCWGLGNYGQLGNGSNNSQSSPVGVLGGLSFKQISNGIIHTCGITSSGKAYCWGYSDSRKINSPVAVNGSHIFSQITAGSSSCAINQYGRAYCWGGGGWGQLGNGTNSNHNNPVEVDDENVDFPIGSYLGVGTTEPVYNLHVSGTAGGESSWQISSDERLKKEIAPISSALEKILSLRGVSFRWKKDDFPERNFKSSTQIGLIAQEVERIFPELVNGDEYKSISYANLVAPLIEAIKEQQGQIEAQNKRINYLELQIKNLKK